MVGAGPRDLVEEVVLVELLDRTDADAGLSEREGKAETHGTGPDDDDLFCFGHSDTWVHALFDEAKR
jgi:hypothetical protein